MQIGSFNWLGQLKLYWFSAVYYRISLERYQIIVLDPFHLQGPQQAFESINQSIYTMSGSPKKNISWYGTQKPLNQNLKIYLYIYQKETAIFLATKHEKTVMACSYLIFLKIFPSFWTCGLQCYKKESIHLNLWPGTIVIRNRKIIWKHRSFLLIFWLELKLFGVAVQTIHQNSKKW